VGNATEDGKRCISRGNNIKTVKLKVKGWIEEDGEAYSNVPKVCPKCRGKLWKTDALGLCNILWVGCRNLKCRWSEIYEL
jgi:hypothetical protein